VRSGRRTMSQTPTAGNCPTFFVCGTVSQRTTAVREYSFRGLRLAGGRKSRCYNSRPSNGGAVAQLGERLVRNEKVRSSILLGSTNFLTRRSLSPYVRRVSRTSPS